MTLWLPLCWPTWSQIYPWLYCTKTLSELAYVISPHIFHTHLVFFFSFFSSTFNFDKFHNRKAEIIKQWNTSITFTWADQGQTHSLSKQMAHVVLHFNFLVSSHTQKTCEFIAHYVSGGVLITRSIILTKCLLSCSLHKQPRYVRPHGGQNGKHN